MVAQISTLRQRQWLHEPRLRQNLYKAYGCTDVRKGPPATLPETSLRHLLVLVQSENFAHLLGARTSRPHRQRSSRCFLALLFRASRSLRTRTSALPAF